MENKIIPVCRFIFSILMANFPEIPKLLVIGDQNQISCFAQSSPPQHGKTWKFSTRPNSKASPSERRWWVRLEVKIPSRPVGECRCKCAFVCRKCWTHTPTCTTSGLSICYSDAVKFNATCICIKAFPSMQPEGEGRKFNQTNRQGQWRASFSGSFFFCWKVEKWVLK